MRHFKANPFKALCDWQREYGDIVSFRLATRQFYLFSHPKLIEQALIKQSDVFVKMYNPKKPTGLALVLGQGLGNSQQITPQIFPEHHLKTYVFCESMFNTSLLKICR